MTRIIAPLIFTRHAADRMAEYGWTPEDVAHVAANPEASYPGDNGCPSNIGTAPDGRCMRVVFSSQMPNRVVTVVWPDSNR